MGQELAIFEGNDAPPEVEIDVTSDAAPPETAAAPEGEIAAPPAAHQEPASHQAPLQALLDEREKRQEAQRRAEDAERRAKEFEQRFAATQTPQRRPDFFENPDIAVSQMLYGQRLQQSRFLAEREFGADEVKAAFEFFDSRPELTTPFQSHPSPFHAAVDVYRQHKAMAEIGSDPVAYRERIRAEIMAELQPTAAPQSSNPKPPPLSLAAAPSAGRSPNVPNLNVPPRLTALFG